MDWTSSDEFGAFGQGSALNGGVPEWDEFDRGDDGGFVSGTDALQQLEQDEQQFVMEEETAIGLGTDVRLDPTLMQTPREGSEKKGSRLPWRPTESPSTYFRARAPSMGKLVGDEEQPMFFSPGNHNNKLLTTPKVKRPFTFAPVMKESPMISQNSSKDSNSNHTFARPYCQGTSFASPLPEDNVEMDLDS